MRVPREMFGYDPRGDDCAAVSLETPCVPTRYRVWNNFQRRSQFTRIPGALFS